MPPNTSRAKTPPRISRSRMMNIPSRDLFAAMDLGGQELAEIRSAAGKARYQDACAAWGGYFADRSTPTHMPQPACEGGPALVVKEAERVVDHEIQGWHTVTHKFGKLVDFNAEWGRNGKYGTHYLAWMTPLRGAFELTGDTRYPACFDDLFNQWYEQRDRIDHPKPGQHVIFYELGIGGRTPRLIDHYFAYRNTGVLSDRTHERMLKTILGGCRWLHRWETDGGFRHGNWQMCGSWGLVYAGGLFPEFIEAADWVRVGTQRLLEHADTDFYDDGCHSERATGYGSWCTRMTEDLWNFSRLNPSVKLDVDLRQRIRLMYEWWLSIATPLGEGQGFNDGGFGQIDEILKRGAGFTGDGALLWPIRDRVTSVDGIKPRKPSFTSVDKRPSGFAVMRSGWDRKDLFMILNHGPFGGGHTHNGLLDFAMYAYGAPLAMEASRWGPYDNPLDHYFRSPQAHNQVVVNDAPMDRKRHRGEDPVWATGRDLDYFSAVNRAYQNSFGASIERRVVLIRPDYFVVSDTVIETSRHNSYTWYLHSPSRWRAGKARSVTLSKPGLQVVPARPSEVRRVRQGTSYEAQDGAPGPQPDRHWIGLQKWVPTEGVKAVVYDVALVPFRTQPTQVKVTRLEAELDGDKVRPEAARGIQVARRGQTDLVVYGDGERQTNCGPLSFRGRACVVTLKAKRPVRVAVVDGGEVSYDGKALLKGVKPGLTEKRL
jgi:hypothetical protein